MSTKRKPKKSTYQVAPGAVLMVDHKINPELIEWLDAAVKRGDQVCLTKRAPLWVQP